MDGTAQGKIILGAFALGTCMFLLGGIAADQMVQEDPPLGPLPGQEVKMTMAPTSGRPACLTAILPDGQAVETHNPFYEVTPRILHVPPCFLFRDGFE